MTIALVDKKCASLTKRIDGIIKEQSSMKKSLGKLEKKMDEENERSKRIEEIVLAIEEYCQRLLEVNEEIKKAEGLRKTIELLQTNLLKDIKEQGKSTRSELEKKIKEIKQFCVDMDDSARLILLASVMADMDEAIRKE